MKRTFQPTIGFSIFTALLMMLLLSLGTWQMQRKTWKEGFLQQIERYKSEAPIAIDSLFDNTAAQNLQDLNYRPARITGTYLHQYEFLLGPRVHKGQSGAHLYAPFKTLTGNIILVNRGWIPDKTLQDISRPTHEVTLTGLIHMPSGKGKFTPDNDLQNNIWYWVDMNAVKTQTNLKNFYPVIFYNNINPAQKLPIGSQLRINIPNDHLQYAITWYLLALILGVMYVFYHYKPDE